ncbi:hypothetical protein GGX14DRAFT_572435 [Mycena pura]|uniref:MYND-type domain-containing protein n=1 Tax=Mycena pura TaxID=153505 RepID=A0AAD6Y5A5_9AGAR|nr:hypothetical protein GGX14DRAFT_572435 [Mycena pura]
MDSSLLLSNLSRLPLSLRKQADDALNGSHHAFHALAQSIDKIIDTSRRLIIPVFYVTLDPARIGALDQLESLDPGELMRRFLRAFQSLRTISVLFNRGAIPPEAFVHLWPSVWQCIEFWTRQAYALFMEVFVAFLQDLNQDERRVVSETPGTIFLIGTAWSYLVRAEHSDAFNPISVILSSYTIGPEPAGAAFIDALVAGAGGTWTDLSSTISLMGVMSFLRKHAATRNSPLEFHNALLKQGIIPALITISLALSKSPRSPASDFVQPMAFSVLITLVFTSCIHYNRIVTALREGFLLALFSTVRTCELEVQYPQRRLDSLATVRDLDPALHFRTPIVLDDWRRFVTLVEERLQVAREWKAGSLTKFNACDDLNCGQIRKKDQFKRCSRCRNSFYCSRKCQKADYREGGHRGDCSVTDELRKDANSDRDAKSPSFLRALLNYDYAHRQEQIALMLLAEMHAHPEENVYTVCNYECGLSHGCSGGRILVHMVEFRRGDETNYLVIPLRTTGELSRGLRRIVDRMPPSTDGGPIDLEPYHAEVRRLIASENTGGAKSYDRVCSDPTVFGEMLSLAAVTKWKIHKHTAGEFHWQAIMGDIFLSARRVGTGSASGQTTGSPSSTTYEEAMAREKITLGLAVIDEKDERTGVAANWPFE